VVSFHLPEPDWIKAETASPNLFFIYIYQKLVIFGSLPIGCRTMPDSSPQLDEADNIAGTQDKISQKKDCRS